MQATQAINSSNNVILINLDQVQLEDIVEQKLLYFLSQKSLSQKVIKAFYEPVEQALIEVILGQQKSNQMKAAQVLGINRNTLKKKIILYKIDLKQLLIKEHLLQAQNQIFVSSLLSLDLLSVARMKLYLDKSKNCLPKEKLIQKICQPVEVKIFQTVLNHFKGNQIRSSRFLEINRYTLKKKLNLNGKKERAS